MNNAINHNLEVAKPQFIMYRDGISNDLFKWIQYRGVEVENSSRLVFVFKSSQSSLTFKIYAGVNTGDIYTTLLAHSNDIYQYFKELKSNK